MASITWISTSSGDWSVGANWSGGSAPVNGDTVTFNGAVGTASVTSGLNQAAVTLATLNVTPGYTGSIASAGSPLLINVSGRMRLAGTGSAYAISGTLADVRCQGKGTSGTTITLGGTVSLLYGQKGTIVILTGATVTTAFTYFGSTSDGSLTIPSGVTGPTTLHMERGGVVTTASAFTTANIGVGATLTHTAGAATAINNRGGTYNGQSSGTITTLTHLAGTSDFSDNYNAFTVTNAYGLRGTIDRRNGMGGGTWTNGIITLSSEGLLLVHDDVGTVRN